jgi:chromosome segregation ATPase
MGRKEELEQEWQDHLYQLGETARTDMPEGHPDLRTFQRVVKAWGALEDRRAELAIIEQQMDEEERSLAEAREDAEAEYAECLALVKKYSRALNAVDEEIKKLQKAKINREGALKYVYRAEEEEIRKIDELIEAGKLEKAEASKRNLKKIKLEAMKGEREIRECEERIAELLDPPEGTVGAEGIVARNRMQELEQVIAERDEELEALLDQLNKQAARKERDIEGAQDFYDQAVSLLGAEIFEARVRHPSFDKILPALDQIAAELRGKR